jgi:hypothetical protein
MRRNPIEEGITHGVLTMKMQALLITSALLIGFAGAAVAADHLHEAMQHGLSDKPADHPAFNRSESTPGQGSPFSGEDRGIPATDTETSAHQFGNDPDQPNLPGKADPPSAEPLK